MFVSFPTRGDAAFRAPLHHIPSPCLPDPTPSCHSLTQHAPLLPLPSLPSSCRPSRPPLATAATPPPPPTLCSVLYPRRVTHMLCQGVSNSYITHGGITRGGEVHTAYQLPASPPVPCDVQYLETVSPCVPVRVLGLRGN